ncbi:iron-containing redox enzyme family protein [Actinoplanes sp. NPDC051633]|uniref:iron-containing redox enzyme family protein n=1 Tax=Actinoplanes sp. NPDC051633 TaxID=3155670 RepID=UPI00341FE7AD
MKLPSPRGPVSAAVIDALARPPHDVTIPSRHSDDDDLHLTLFVLYELSYRGWDGVDDDWEWQPSLIAARTRLEKVFEGQLIELAGPVTPPAQPIARELIELTSADTGPSLSKFLRGRATRAQFREFAAHRSVYHLREADPHTYAIPRLGGAAKAALIEIQIDEYGNGREPRMHQELFKRTMVALDLDTTYGAYVDVVPARTLAINNMMSLFALHRSRRGAIIGHLAAYEMTSTAPNRAYGNGLRRLGGDADATAFYDEHVEADAVHEQIAAYDLCGSFAAAEPGLAGDVLFGARCALALDQEWATEVLARWDAGESSLREPLP